MLSKIRTAFRLLKDTFLNWFDDNAGRLGAALAFYTLFSLAPLLLICIAVAGFVFGEDVARNELLGTIKGFIGESGATAIEGMLNNAEKPESGVKATVIGIFTLLLGASAVFGQLQDAFNEIWKVRPKPGQPFLRILKKRFRAFAVVLGTGFLLLTSLVISTALAALEKYFTQALPGGASIWQFVNLGVSFGVVTFLFAAMYRIIPDVKLKWQDVWLGGAFTAVLFTLGKYAIGTYLGKSSVTSVYGAAGSLVIVLLWLYYSAQILFLGAEFTKVYARHCGKECAPQEHAEIRVERAA
ncbi:MAG: YihY/virulence factor BrkB family protein [Bdellovibrionota bacterium]